MGSSSSHTSTTYTTNVEPNIVPVITMRMQRIIQLQDEVQRLNRILDPQHTTLEEMRAAREINNQLRQAEHEFYEQVSSLRQNYLEKQSQMFVSQATDMSLLAPNAAARNTFFNMTSVPRLPTTLVEVKRR